MSLSIIPVYWRQNLAGSYQIAASEMTERAMYSNFPDKGVLDEATRRIRAVIEPRQVILFGSAARGEMGANSDLDLLVVVSTGLHRRQTAQKIYRNLIGLGFAADIVVVTEDDLVRYRDQVGMIIKPALEEGKVLYAA